MDDDYYLAGPLVTHLVFVDGRLVETWQEPAAGTSWASHAHPAAPPPPPPPLHEQVRTWLESVCGGAAALDRLDARPLNDDMIDLPVEYAQAAWRQRMESTAELLDAVAASHFDAETSFAFRHALLALWRDDPETVTRASSAAHVAGGVAWAVGKANGLFNPVGTMQVGIVQHALGLRSPVSAPGQSIAAALRGFRPHTDRWSRPPGVPDLLPLGRSDLLLGSTRERVVRMRTRAREAADAA